MDNLFNQHNIKMVAVSPISILADSGRDLSPYADYIVSEEGDELYYVNHSLIERKLTERPELINEFANGIRDSMDNNRANFNLSRFITQRLGIDLDTFRIVKAEGDWSKKKRNVQSIAKDAERLYIAGSSLKGAIRTALLYQWLAYSDEGNEEVEKVVKVLTALAPKCERLNQLKKRRELDFNAKRERKELEDERKRVINQIFDEEHLFGKLNPKRDDAQIAPFSQAIICRDSQIIPNTQLFVTQAGRIRRLPARESRFGTKRESVIPQPREALKKGTEIHTSFSIRTGQIPENHPLSYLNENTDYILNVLNEFSLDFVNYEINKLEDAPQFHKDVDELIAFYYDLNERMKDGECFLRLGAGKTFYDNSLVLALLTHENPKIREQSAKDLQTIFPNDIKSLHPVTRTVSASGKPFGWVKVVSKTV